MKGAPVKGWPAREGGTISAIECLLEHVEVQGRCVEVESYLEVVDKRWCDDVLDAVAKEVGDEWGAIDGGADLSHPLDGHVW